MAHLAENRPLSRANLGLALRGRLGRKNYLALCIFWSFVCIIPACIIASAKLYLDFDLLLGSFNNAGDLARGAAAILWMLTFFYAICTMLANTVRRLHDMNFSGWWALAAIIFFVPAFFISTSLSSEYTPLIIVTILLTLWVFFILLMPGTSSINRFGDVTPNPSKSASMLVYGGGVVLIASTLPILYLAFVIFAMAHWVGHC